MRAVWVLCFACCLISVSPVSGEITGCVKGNDKIETRARSLDRFDEIEIDGAFELTAACSEEQNVLVSADSNLIPHIMTRVKGTRLEIYVDKSICTDNSLKIIIKVKNLKKIISSGANDIKVNGLDNKGLSIESQGAGDITLAGKTGEFSAIIKDAGEIHAGGLKADSVDIDVTDAGDALVNASKVLKARAGGAGSIVFRGKPAQVTKKISDGGEITSENED